MSLQSTGELAKYSKSKTKLSKNKGEEEVKVDRIPDALPN